eukprot:9639172-Alexandrium_andersonii.AAC.1
MRLGTAARAGAGHAPSSATLGASEGADGRRPTAGKSPQRGKGGVQEGRHHLQQVAMPRSASAAHGRHLAHS